MNKPSRYGPRIAALRVTRKLSQKDMAFVVGVSEGHLSALERGTRTPSPELVARIERIFGISLELDGKHSQVALDLYKLINRHGKLDVLAMIKQMEAKGEFAE